jgi:toxin ParE1/3/4
MDKYKIELTKSAENDLISIGNYIKYELLEPKIAEKTVSNIIDKIESLEKMPFKHKLVNDFEGIRKIIVNNYIIFYSASEKSKEVKIVRVLYARRDWINLI